MIHRGHRELGGNEGRLPHYELVMEAVLLQDAEAAGCIEEYKAPPAR